MHPDYATFWTAIGAMSTGLAAILGAIALLYTISAFRKTMKTNHYTSLDTMYMTILNMTLERPHLKTPRGVKDEIQKSEYDTFAYILWNFLESIYDHCLEDKHLQSTWYPAISAESKVHQAWLEEPENRTKFKKDFCRFIRDGCFDAQ